MKSVALLVVLACVVVYNVEGGRGWWKEKVAPKANAFIGGGLSSLGQSIANGRRELDLNQDGLIDQSELETIMSAREARAVLKLAEDDALFV